jgi:hypothetical protein
MLRKNVLAFVAILLILALPVSFAQGIQVHRDYPSSAAMNSVIQINITVENPGSFGTMATIQENAGDYTSVEPLPVIPKGTPGMIGLRLAYYEWNITLNPGENKTVYYKVNLTSPGEVMLSPTAVIVGNETIYGESGLINVICNQNQICEKDLGENYLTCLQDCPTGAADGLCDLMKDGKCDPDCTPGSDIDCLIPENNETQPSDNKTNPGVETKPGNETPIETPPKSALETYWWIIPIILILIIALIVIYLKKRSKPKQTNEWQADYQNAPVTNPPANPVSQSCLQ